MESAIASTYGNRVRVRVCGMCWDSQDQLLMVRHAGLVAGGFWAPPGGGVEFGETLEQALKREFLEETGLDIRVGGFMFGCEVFNHPLHAVELFFAVSIVGGSLKKGHDPEIDIIEKVAFVSPSFLKSLAPSQLHGIFKLAMTQSDFKQIYGFNRI